MNADFYIIWIGPSGRKIMPVYCRPEGICSDDENVEPEDAIQHLEEAFPELCGVVQHHNDQPYKPGNRSSVL